MLLFLNWYNETRRTFGFNFAFSIENQLLTALKVNDRDRLIHETTMQVFSYKRVDNCLKCVRSNSIAPFVERQITGQEDMGSNLLFALIYLYLFLRICCNIKSEIKIYVFLNHVSIYTLRKYNCYSSC